MLNLWGESRGGAYPSVDYASLQFTLA
jgi:hypothetical protein